MVRKRIATCHPWRRLEQIPIKLSSLHSPSPAGLTLGLTQGLTRASIFLREKVLTKIDGLPSQAGNDEESQCKRKML